MIYTLSGGSDAAGAVITFTDIVGGTQTLTLDAAGNATATVTVAADEDSIMDASSFTVTDAAVTNAGNLEAAAIDATGSTTTIADTLDTTTVTVGDASVNEDASSASVAVTLLGHVFTSGETVTVTLGDGTTVEFTDNGTQNATYGFTADPDSIVDPGTAPITATVASDAGDIEDASVTAGTLTVTDSIDTTTITLNATSSITEAGGDVIYTLSGGSDAAGAVITFTDIVGGTQTLTLDAAGNATATVTVAADEDSIMDASSFTVTDAAVTNAGNLEAAAIDATGSTTTIADTLDTTTVTVGDASVNEDASSASVAVTLLGHVFTSGETVTVTLGDGTTVEFTDNGTQNATYGFTADPDSIVDPGTAPITATVASDAGDIEDASVTAGTLTVTDSIDTTTITLNATSSITEAGGDVIYTLSGGSDAAGAVITFTDIVGGTQTLTLDAAGNATATVTVAADEDSIMDASSFTVTDAAVTNAGNLKLPRLMRRVRPRRLPTRLIPRR